MRSFCIGAILLALLDIGSSRDLLTIEAGGLAAISMVLGVFWVLATVHDVLKEGGRRPVEDGLGWSMGSGALCLVTMGLCVRYAEAASASPAIRIQLGAFLATLPILLLGPEPPKPGEAPAAEPATAAEPGAEENRVLKGLFALLGSSRAELPASLCALVGIVAWVQSRLPVTVPGPVTSVATTVSSTGAMSRSPVSHWIWQLVISANYRHPEELVKQATARLNGGDVIGACELLRTAARDAESIEPKDPVIVAHFRAARAFAEFMGGDIARAESAIDSALQDLPPREPLAREGRYLLLAFKSMIKLVQNQQAVASSLIDEQASIPHPETISPEIRALSAISIGYVRLAAGRFAEAESSFYEAKSHVSRSRGEGKLMEVVPVLGLAMVYLKKNDLDRAGVMIDEAVMRWQSQLGARHPLVAVPGLRLQAMVRLLKHRVEDAERIYHEAVGIVREKLPANHPAVTQLVDEYATLLEAQNRNDEARRVRQGN